MARTGKCFKCNNTREVVLVRDGEVVTSKTKNWNGRSYGDLDYCELCWLKVSQLEPLEKKVSALEEKYEELKKLVSASEWGW